MGGERCVGGAVCQHAIDGSDQWFDFSESGKHRFVTDGISDDKRGPLIYLMCVKRGSAGLNPLTHGFRFSRSAQFTRIQFEFLGDERNRCVRFADLSTIPKGGGSKKTPEPIVGETKIASRFGHEIGRFVIAL